MPVVEELGLSVLGCKRPLQICKEVLQNFCKALEHIFLFSHFHILFFFSDIWSLFLFELCTPFAGHYGLTASIYTDIQDIAGSLNPTTWSLLRYESLLLIDSGWSKGDGSVAWHGSPGFPPVDRLGTDIPAASCPLHQEDLVCPPQHKGISCASITALFSCLAWRANWGNWFWGKKTISGRGGLCGVWPFWVPFPDCASSLLCLHCPVLQPDCPSVWEIPSIASWALDVWSSANLYQVCLIVDAVFFM